MKTIKVFILLIVQCVSVSALDWPTYRHDSQRTGITSEQLILPLSNIWTFKSDLPPERAWPAPFRDNPYSGTKVEPLLTFDHAFQPIACGTSVFFGSSSDHQIYCLDIESGKIKWTFYSEGPIRTCPTFDRGRLYFGSDDGNVYCLNAETGIELWRHLVGPNSDKIPGNEQIISRWPVRSGVLVENGVLYSAGGIFPAREGSYLFALDAYSGKNKWKRKINQTAQGYLLATPSKIFVPSGKLTPLTYNRENGEYISRLSGPRGNFALIVDDVIVSGPGISGDKLVAFGRSNKQYSVANFKANKAIISPQSIFLASGTEIIRRNRKPLALKSLEKRKNNLVNIANGERDWKKSQELKLKIDAQRKSFEEVLDLNNRIQWQAEEFNRGNVIVDRELYGNGIGVISDPGGQKNFAEYDVVVGSTGLFKLEFRYAARLPRPGRVLIDGKVVKEQAISKTTGGWGPEHQNWHSEGIVKLFKKKSILRIESEPMMSHIDQIRLTPLIGDVARMERISSVIEGLNQQLAKLSETAIRPIESSVATRGGSIGDQIKATELAITKLVSNTSLIKEWKQPIKEAKSIILAGKTLFVGRKDEILAIDSDTGRIDWSFDVEGVVHGVLVANGFLVATTDKGRIYCFSQQGKPRQFAQVDFKTKDTFEEIEKSYFKQDFSNKLFSKLDQLKGYALVRGGLNFGLPSEILNKTDFDVVYVEENTSIVKKARDYFNKHLQYGDRIVVHKKVEDKLSYPDLMFNFVCIDVSELGSGELLLEEYLRVLRPFGTMVIGGGDSIGKYHNKLSGMILNSEGFSLKSYSSMERKWLVVQRGKLPGGGDWSHQYANLGNTACSEDARVNGDLKLQWYGKPGPYRMFDRHAYTAAPVYSSGRLFTLGEKVLYANDAYNGYLLWEKELPDLEPRVNLPRDCGYMATDGTHVYLAVKDNCIKINAKTGRTEQKYNCQKTDDKYNYNWGYVGVTNKILLGSNVRSGNFYTEGRGPWYDDSSFGNADDSHKVLSDCIFAYDLTGNKRMWKHNGVIINSTITVGGGRIYFVENRNLKVLNDESRRLSGGEEWMSLYLVALDMITGELVWDEEMRFQQRTPVFFSSYKNELLVVLRSNTESFELRAIDAKSGKAVWAKNHGWESNHHGAHRRHPVIIGDVVYQQPHAYDLKTGSEKWSTSKVGVGGNCGTLSASSSMLFSRLSDYPGFIDLGQGMSKENLVEITRPGCWINIVPVGGMVLVPEAGSGCSCEYSIHASMGFLPESTGQNK